MQIQPIPEEAHNTAMLTLAAERQELLFYRSRVPALEQQILDLNLKLQQHEATTEGD